MHTHFIRANGDMMSDLPKLRGYGERPCQDRRDMMTDPIKTEGVG